MADSTPSTSRPQSPLVVPSRKRNKTPNSTVTSTVAPVGYQARQVFVPPAPRTRTTSRLSATGSSSPETARTKDPSGADSSRARTRPATTTTTTTTTKSGSMRRKSNRTKTTLLLPNSHKMPPIPPSISQTIAGGGSGSAPRTPNSQRVRIDPHLTRLPITPYTAKLTRTIHNYDADKDPIKTYLRIRPLKPEEDPVDPFITLLNDKEIKLSDCKKQSRVYASSQYLFTRVFGNQITQQSLFQSTTLPVIQEFFDGYNTLIFAYGVTNSGKTYTIQGTRDQPGIIPRALNIILHHIKDAQSEVRIRPARASDAAYCTEDILFQPQFRTHREQSAIRQTLNDLIAHDEHILNLDTHEFEYAIWVSYAEIYNEFIYDLLDLKTLVTGSMPPAVNSQPGSRVNSPDPNYGGTAPRRIPRRKGNSPLDHGGGGNSSSTVPELSSSPSKRLNMKIRTDVDDGHYLEGITEIRIRTLEDALAVLAHGQKHRTANSTLLNQESSRSHSIFTVKLLRIRRQMSVGADTCIEPHMVQVQKMSIVDLAGSERAAKTQNTGDRLHEAGMINKSLMVLGNCLETLRFNQFKSDKMRPQMVPFRESQLTKLFQSSFMGGAKTVMLVNVNPYDDSYEETRRVLKFAAVAKDVTTVNTPIASTPLYRAVLHSKPPVFGLYEDPPDQDRPPKRKRGTAHAVPDPSELNSILTSPSLGPSSNTRCSTPAGPGSEARLSLLNTPEPPLLPDGGLSDCDEPHMLEDDDNDGDAAMDEDPVPTVTVTPVDPSNPGFTFTFDVAKLSGAIKSPPSPPQPVIPPDSVVLTQAEWDEQQNYTLELREALNELKEQYTEAQYRCAQIEFDVRQELSQEYNRKILEMEERYNQRLQDEVMLNEEKCKSKIDILTRSHSEAAAAAVTVGTESVLVEKSTAMIEDIDMDMEANQTPRVQEGVLALSKEQSLLDEANDVSGPSPAPVVAPCNHDAILAEQEQTMVQLRSQINHLKIQEAQDLAKIDKLNDDLDRKHASWQEEKTLHLLVKSQNLTLENELRRAKGIRTECDRRVSDHSVTWHNQVKTLQTELDRLTKDHESDRLGWEREKLTTGAERERWLREKSDLEITVAELRGQLNYEKEARKSFAHSESAPLSPPQPGSKSPDAYDVSLLQQIQKLQYRVADRDQEINANIQAREEYEAMVHDLKTKNHYLLQQMRILKLAHPSSSASIMGGAASSTGGNGSVAPDTPSGNKILRVFQHLTPEAKSLRSPSMPTALLSGLHSLHLQQPQTQAQQNQPQHPPTGEPRPAHTSQQQRLMKSSFLKKTLFGKKQLQYDEYEAEVLDVNEAEHQVVGTTYRGPILPSQTGGIHVVFSDLTKEPMVVSSSATSSMQGGGTRGAGSSSMLGSPPFPDHSHQQQQQQQPRRRNRGFSESSSEWGGSAADHYGGGVQSALSTAPGKSSLVPPASARHLSLQVAQNLATGAGGPLASTNNTRPLSHVPLSSQDIERGDVTSSSHRIRRQSSLNLDSLRSKKHADPPRRPIPSHIEGEGSDAMADTSSEPGGGHGQGHGLGLGLGLASRRRGLTSTSEAAFHQQPPLSPSASGFNSPSKRLLSPWIEKAKATFRPKQSTPTLNSAGQPSGHEGQPGSGRALFGYKK
ncbi:hypothetical protein H4R33_005668 [Dimargaris cristalligena]|nr:hypothetical protein H4R33_005668 [Dimargaris cristalligena]